VKSIALLLTMVGLAAILPAQTTNNQSLSGTVQDSSGAFIPNATVTVVSEGTNLTRSATSNESGAYFISNLPIGFYELSATAQGFKKFVASHVELTVGQQAAMNVTLDVGNVNESVNVQADAVRVEASTGEISNLITGTQASQIQLNGRNFPSSCNCYRESLPLTAAASACSADTASTIVVNRSMAAERILSHGIWMAPITRQWGRRK